MRVIAPRLALILAGAVLLSMVVALATSRPEYCGPLDTPRLHASSASARARVPTPAPPENLVFVKVESDKPDIQIGWAEN